MSNSKVEKSELGWKITKTAIKSEAPINIVKRTVMLLMIISDIKGLYTCILPRQGESKPQQAQSRAGKQA